MKAGKNLSGFGVITPIAQRESKQRGDNTQIRSGRISRNSDQESLPRTTKPERVSADGSSAVIVSIAENLAKEVCIAKYDCTNKHVLEVYLVVDCFSYAETISILTDIRPDEILLHDGSKRKVLSTKIESIMSPISTILYISRQYFDQDRGANMLKRVVAGSVDSDVIAKYTVLAGSYCLLRYMENIHNSQFAPNSIRLEYCNNYNGRVNIDRRAAVQLELISNILSGNQRESLFGSINYTKTVTTSSSSIGEDMTKLKLQAVGARFLRSCILRPSTDIPTLTARLDIVEILLRKSSLSEELSLTLKRFPDISKALGGLTTIPNTKSSASARIGIDTLIFLKQVLALMPGFSAIISKLHHEMLNRFSSPSETEKLLEVMLSVCSQEKLTKIKILIEDTLIESTTASKSSHEMRHQECFALKSGINELLDLARKTYLICIHDIYEKGDFYSNELDIPVRVAYSMSRGYYLSIPALAIDSLPDIFIKPVLNAKTISCTTNEISALSDRAGEAISNALSITNTLIQDVMASIREHMDSLFALTDCIALLDMLSSFADLVAFSPHSFCRPVLKLSGSLIIRSGRHPVLGLKNTNQMASSFVENDTFLDPTSRMTIITGSNGSGKTVYIKQVALMVILAQIGSFIPARAANIPIRERIFCRLGTSDDMEHNMSTFQIEMKECKNILSSVTPNSLVIIDELGRGTSNNHGLALAFAIGEELYLSKAFVLFVTHYSQITLLSSMYFGINNVHIRSDIESGQAEQLFSKQNAIQQPHKLIPGPYETICGYGITMAENCGFPAPIIADARKMLPIVMKQLPSLLRTSSFTDPAAEMAKDILRQLISLSETITDQQLLCSSIQNLRQTITDANALNILMYFKKQCTLESDTDISSSRLTLSQRTSIKTSNPGNDKENITINNPQHRMDSLSFDELSETKSKSDLLRDSHDEVFDEIYLTGDSNSNSLIHHTTVCDIWRAEDDASIPFDIQVHTSLDQTVQITDKKRKFFDEDNIFI